MLKGLKKVFPLPKQLRRTPEEEELANQKSQLDQTRADLAEAELALVTLRAELASFEGMFLRTVGVMYAELDELNAQAEERIAKTVKTASAEYQSGRARERAGKSRARASSAAARAPGFHPTPELMRLYREVVGHVHPELTNNLRERTERGQLMADANLAFESCDAEKLTLLMQGHEASAEPATGEVSDQLANLTSQITQIQQRLSRIEAETKQIMQTSAAQRWTQAKEARSEGRDLLAEMAANLLPQIRAARNR